MRKRMFASMIMLALAISTLFGTGKKSVLAASENEQSVIEIVPGMPEKTASSSGYVYSFDKLEVKAPEWKKIKNVVVQFTSEVDDGDTIKAPNSNSKFQVLADSTTANQSINCTNGDGYTAEEWQEYLRGTTITLKNAAEKTVRFMANSEEKATGIYDYNATNKHYYQLIVKTTADFVNGKAPKFSDAYQAIQVDKKYQYMGSTGYMVTVTTEQEMKFVTSVIKNGDFVWLGATCASPYIDSYLTRDGYSSNPNSYYTGLFYWISGPEEGTKMWEGSRRANPNATSYTTFWRSEYMEYGQVSGTTAQDDFDGLYVATYPTKATYWVWCNQPEDVIQDGKQGYQKQIINWMVEYDDIPEVSTENFTVKDCYLNPSLKSITVKMGDVTYGEDKNIVVTDENNKKVTTGLNYTYYGQDASGQYTVKLTGEPKNVGNYKLVVSGSEYTPVEETFSIVQKKIVVSAMGNDVTEHLTVKQGSKLSDVKLGHDLTVDKLAKNDTLSIFGEAKYTWEKAQNTRNHTDDVLLTEGDVYILSVKFTGNSEALKNYQIEYKELVLDVENINIDTDGDGDPDINIDTDGDGDPDINIDTDGDGDPDINVDTDGDGIPDINIDTDGDGDPDINIDTDGDGDPDINIDTDGDGDPDINIDTDGDGDPDINIDTDGDGEPDINIDTDGDGDTDINIDTDGDGIPNINIDTDGDGDPDINVDTDGDGDPDINVDTDGDGEPDINIDTDGDGDPDINVDTDGDGDPDINIDTDGDGIPDINIDTDGDGDPDINIDTDGDGDPDINIDTDGDGNPDINVDTDGDGDPDTNVDLDRDGVPELNIDTDGDGKPDKNIDANHDGVIDPILNDKKEDEPKKDEIKEDESKKDEAKLENTEAIEENKDKKTEENTAVHTGDTQNIWWYVCLMLGAFLATVELVRRKEK